MKLRRPKRYRSTPGSSPGSLVQVVGVGASAGGLDAFRRFLKAMPGDGGLAFVLIQHFDPTHKSHMAELLSKYTSMRVQEAVHRTPIEKDCVYVIPPNRSMSIRGNRLHLAVPVQRRGFRTPIDHFFLSLAKERGEKAICIILSSSGTDGVLGLRAVKAAGGMSMVQDPATAEYGDLPRNAIATGLVDSILPAEQMPRALLGYLGHSYFKGDGPLEDGSNGAEESLEKIHALIHDRTSNDFRFYKRGTLVRRIERRMGLNQIKKLPDYVRLLKKEPAEVIELSKDLMIGVTSFFRDAEAFEELGARVIPGLVRNAAPQGVVRVWVPGCATGEEAYSVAILVLEELAATGRSARLQVFATDIDEDALQVARAGRYPESIAADVSAPRLKRFFTPAPNGFLVNTELRAAVVFATQNLISASPFSKIDLISCRNLGIYLEPVIQKKLLELFHFALNPGGFLFLGSSEGVSNREDLFRAVSKKWRIFRRIAGGRREAAAFPILAPGRAAEAPEESIATPGVKLDLSELDRRLTREHAASASVITDSKGKILHLAGPTHQYLELPAGVPTLDLYAVVHESIRPRLRNSLQAAVREERTEVLEAEDGRRDGVRQSLRVTIRPVKSPPSAEGLLHVVFEDLPAPAKRAAGIIVRAEDSGGEEVRRLEAELKSTRNDLQSTIEEAETSNEELKVANEEVLSSNEELQSTNEELETSKEELQSLNEELSTLNTQLQEKVQELTETTNDLSNLLTSTEIATVFLDTKFRIKRFTQPVARLLNLIPTDVGRPIRHMVQNLVGVDILEDAQSVLRKLVPLQREVRSQDGASYVMRVLPYRTTENVIQGVVLTFSDVSDLAAKEARLRERDRRQRMIVELGQVALARTPLNRLLHVAVRRAQEIVNSDLSDILLRDDSGKWLEFAAGAGWKKAVPGKSRVAASGSKAPALALRSRNPVFMDPARSPHLSKPSSLQRKERVVSSMYMPLLSPSGALGVLGAHSKRKREFTAEDSLVFQDLAHIVANALTREQIEAQLKEAGRLLEVRVRERTAWLEASQEISRAANRAETMTEVMHSSLVALCSGAGWRMGHIFLASKDKPVRPVFHSSWYPKGSGRFLPFERLTRRASASGALSLPSAVLRKGKPAWILPVYPAHPERRGLSRAGRESAWEFSGQFQRLQPPRAGLARQLGIISAAAVPVKAGRDLLGVIEVFSDREIAPRRPLLDMMEQAAAEIGRSAERIQSQERFAAALWREQRSIAQELHDNVGQELTGLGVMSGSLLSTLRRKGRIDASRLKHLTEGLQITLEKLRNVTHGLFPVEVNPTGLQAALARLARQTRSRFGVHCTLRHGANVPVPSREAATHLYRIAQEAVTNAVRHAMARRIHISLVRSARIITLTIRDDGRGLPQGGNMPEGVGLRIMRHRAKAIGGRLTVRSGRRRGTAVICTLPRPGSDESMSDGG